MMYKFYCFVFFAFLQLTGWAQETSSTPVDTLLQERLLTMINFNREQSYLSFGSGIGNQVPILFEARFSPSYFVAGKQKKWAIMLNPQVQVRMLDKYSVPIQVPSYHLYLSYYRSIDFWKKTFLKKIFYQEAMWFVSAVHHSNGQDGKFYTNDTTKIINLSTGNFSVNFLQLGFSSYTMHASNANFFSLQEIKIHTEIYPYGLCATELKDIYGLYRLFGTFNIGGPWKHEKKDFLSRWLKNSSLAIKAGWIFGEYRGFDALDLSERLIIDLNYRYYPPWFEEIAFFIRFYSGQDYYNIYFEKQLINLTVGITSNTIKLSNATRYVGGKKKKQADKPSF